MENVMPYVRIKQKSQITIPVAVRKAVGVSEGDTLEARAEDGKIILTPQVIQGREELNINMRSMFGVAKHCSEFKTGEEVDTFIRNLRDEC